MSNVGYATVSIIPSTKGFKAALDRQVTPALAAVGHKGGADSGRAAGRGFRGGFLPALSMSALGGPIAVAGAAIGAALGLGITRGLKTAAFLQDAQTGFTTMLGTTKAADKMLADLKAFNLETPFDLPTLVKGAQGMLGVGTSASSVIPNLRAVGDAVSATGGGAEQLAGVQRALNQVQAKGRFQAEEMLQISEQGIPIYGLLGKAMGKSVPELLDLAEKGELLAKDVLPVLYTQMGKDYGGAMAAKSKNLSGVWSNFKDSLDVALSDGVQPLLPILTVALPRAADFLKGAIEGVSSALAGLIDFSRPVADAIGGLFSGGGGGSSELLKTFDALKEFGTSLLPPIKAAFEDIKAAVGPALEQVGDVINGTFLPGVRAILPVIKPVAAFLIGVIGGAVKGAITGVLQVVGGLLKAIGGLFSTIGALFRGDWAAVWQGLKDIVTGVIGGIIGALKTWLNVGILNIFRRAGVAILGSFRGLWSGIRGAAVSGMNTVKSLFMQGLSAVGRIVLGAIKGYFGLWRGLFTTLRNLAVTGWKVLRSAFGGALAAIRSVVSGALRAVGGFFSSTFSSIVSTVRSRISSVVTILKGLPGKALGALKGIGSTLLSAGGDLIRGFIRGIENSAGGIITAIKNAITDKLPGFVKDALDIRSPSRVFMELGGYVSEGMALGITKGGPSVTKAADALVAIPSTKSVTSSAAGVATAAYAGPSTLVLVDADGVLIGRMRVEGAGSVSAASRSAERAF